MTDIIPAVLPHQLDELRDALVRLKDVTPVIQVDVVSDIFAGEEGLPGWEEFDFEFDLYVEPVTFVGRAVELGASSVVIHARHKSVLEAAQLLQPYRQGDFAIRVGIALRPTDTVSVLDNFVGLYDFVQVMGIDNEGHQGEPFNLRAVELVRVLRQTNPELYIQVDGHAAGHERELAQAGANRLVEGSAILTADNPKVALKEAYTRANGS